MIDYQKIENIYCVGRNFEGHARELGNKVPSTPLFFQKSNSTTNFTNTIQIPKSKNIEHELEVVILIGKDADAPCSWKTASVPISSRIWFPPNTTLPLYRWKMAASSECFMWQRGKTLPKCIVFPLASASLHLSEWLHTVE